MYITSSHFFIVDVLTRGKMEEDTAFSSFHDSNSEFALKMRMIAALALVPPLSVVQYFENLCDHNSFPDEAQPVLDYFKDT